MMKSLSSVFLLALTIGAVPPAQQPDRSAAPAPGPPPAVKPPAVVKRTLTSGVPVWIVELHKVPVANVTLVVKAGSAVDPIGRYGLASLTAEMLDEGAAGRNALQIADAADFLGASLSTGSTFDSSSVDLHVPVARLAQALPIMADVALRPSFKESELQRVREERLAGLVQAQDDPEEVVQFAFPRLVYGPEHRYGTMGIGTPSTVKKLTVADLRQFHATRYVPSASALIVTGDVSADRVMPMLESAFGAWKGTAPAAAAIPAAPQLTSRQVFLIDKPGAAQTQIRIGWVGVPRSTPDYFALRILNTILGGAFTSRLNTNLREEHGYAYGARSTFDMRASAGPFYAEAGVQTDKTAESLTEFFKELDGIRTPIPADEIEKAKSYLALQLPRNFETTANLSASLTPMFVYGLPADFFATYTARIRALTQADLQRAADKYIRPDKFAVVVVGDRTAIEPGIRALNLGPLTVVTIDEVMK